jgi:hypothetical protein
VLATDATAPWPDDAAALDAVVTSPPFFDSTRFYLANWMRLWMAGWERADFERRPSRFVDERQRKDLSLYRGLFRQARERLVAGGVVVLHLGKSHKCDMAARLGELARPWFRTVDRFDEDVGHCQSHGIRDQGSVAQHQYLVLA